MNSDQLEDAIRTELRAEAALTPSGHATKNAVLLATENLTAGDQGLRRWVLPALAAAAVVLVVAASVLVPKLLQSKRLHSTGRPNPVTTAPTFTAPKPVNTELDCTKLSGGRLVSGLQTSYTESGTGQKRYVFEYHCLGSNGVRSPSEAQVFSRVNGVFTFFLRPISVHQNAEIMSFRPPAEDGFRERDFELDSGFPGSVDGTIEDGAVYIDPLDGSGGSDAGSFAPIAYPCVAEGRSLAIAAGSAAGESVLRLTNNSTKPCGLEGYPKLVPTAAGRAIGSALVGTLNGPAGGVTKAPVTPIIELQPGQTAAAIIEQTPRHPACPMSDRLSVTLPNGIAMGSVPASVPVCGTTVHPFVNSPSGSD